MQNKAMMYARLAWVYVKGVCALRRKEYDLQFVYEPADKLWYIDMPWPGDRYNLAMVAGSNRLLKFLDAREEYCVRVLVHPSRKYDAQWLTDGYFECERQFSSIKGGATYKVNGPNGFTREIWICPVTLTVLGHYPRYIYIKQLNIDGSDREKTMSDINTKLMQCKFADMNISARLSCSLSKMGIISLGDLMKAPDDMILNSIPKKTACELMDLMETLYIPWGSREYNQKLHDRLAENDRAWCAALRYSLLEDNLKEWRVVEEEYKEHPERFEDASYIDAEGQICADVFGKIVIMPSLKKTYDNFLDDFTNSDSVYSDLSWSGVYMLLESRKFVRRKE